MRLINVDTLMQDIRNTITEQSSIIDWLNLINRQPTAYDADKVVKQLEDWTFNADVNIGDGTKMNHDLIVSKNAIEIVKVGGIDGN